MHKDDAVPWSCTAAHVANTVLECVTVLLLHTYQYSDESQSDSTRKAQMFHLQGRQEPHALGHIQDDCIGLQYKFELF